MEVHDDAGVGAHDFSEAVEALRRAGRHPSRALADAVLGFGTEAVEPLCALLRDPATWVPEALPEAMFPIHLLFLLGCLGDPRAMPTLLEVMQTQDLGDYLTEGTASVLAALGPETVPVLASLLQDHGADPFVRNAAGRALYLVGYASTEARGAVVEALTRVMREADLEDPADFSTAEMLADDVLRTGDPEAIAAVRDAFARGLAHSGFTDESIVDRSGASEAWQRLSHDAPPIAHFEWASRAPRQAALSTARSPMTFAPRSVPVRASPKVGRNDPCPCGSGKKYKKCCGP